MKNTVYSCPSCGAPLVVHERSLKCSKGHSFDFAKEGYVNLLPANKKHAKDPGDDRDMVAARTAFLDAGYYAPLRDTLCGVTVNACADRSGCAVLDCGCGEGFYTARASALCHTTIGFDASKHAAEHGAKRARRDGKDNLHYYTANIFDLPLKDGCADLVLNLFAPVAREEFLRILKPGGRLIVGAAGQRHLMGMKRVLYDTPYENEENNLTLEGFELLTKSTVSYETVVHGQDAIRALFMMTPYYFRTSREDAEKLYSLNELQTEVETDFFVFRKK